MPTEFLLVEAAPGRERDLLDRIERVPQVRQKQVLFGSSIALRLEGGRGTLPRAVARIRRMADVRGLRAYPVRGDRRAS